MRKKKMLRVSLLMPEDLLEWLQDRVRDGTFASVSHGIRRCVASCRDSQRQEGESR